MRILVLLALAAAATGAAAQEKAPKVTIDDRPKARAKGMPPYPAPEGYEWKRYEGEPWNLYKVADAATAAPVVAAPTFQNGGYWPGHNCPTCGRAHYAIVAYNPDGTHSHACWHDGTFWRH